ncbi:phosphoserine phosphatase SerB [Colwelliaceae bacterium 6471]
MSIQVVTLPLIELINASLEQCILPEQVLSTGPMLCQFDNEHFIVDKALATIDLPDKQCTTVTESQDKPSAVELVVFSQLKIEQLINLLNDCHLTCRHLTAINHRNNLISYRFSVDTTDLTRSRQQLVTFTLNHQLEAALIENAPKLELPGILVMDMDSTTIEIECIDEIATLAGVGEEVAAVTELAMQGELDFSQSLHQRVATLANAPESILAEVAQDIPLMKGLTTLIKELKAHQWRIAIASGGFTYFADHLKQALDLDNAFANTLEIIDGKLTGKVLGEVVDASVKAQCLAKLSSEYNIPAQQSVAMGDGANDLKMMAAAQLGVAFQAKPIVQKQADSCINFSGLDCLIHWLA